MTLNDPTSSVARMFILLITLPETEVPYQTNLTLIINFAILNTKIHICRTCCACKFLSINDRSPGISGSDIFIKDTRNEGIFGLIL